MNPIMVMSAAALLLGSLLVDSADARGGFGGGRGGGFAGGGFRGGAVGGGFAGGGFRGGVGGARWAGAGVGRPGWGAAGIGRPGWGAAGIGRPGWGVGRPGWGVGRPGWGHGLAGRRWPFWGAAAGLGLAGAAYYGDYAPYGYGYGSYDDCASTPQQYWDGYGYRTVWTNSCSYY
jgi:hypothetical protein